jgi:transcriptional regulator with XRE-family HTH domain
MPANIIIKFGKRVKEKRLRLGLSQEKLAEMAEAHRNYIGMIERAEKNVSLEKIEKIAKALGTTPSKLLDFK